jgi:hypothetical protein
VFFFFRFMGVSDSTLCSELEDDEQYHYPPPDDTVSSPYDVNGHFLARSVFFFLAGP